MITVKKLITSYVSSSPDCKHWEPADTAHRAGGLPMEQPAPAQPMTQDMVESCPYYAETLRGAYFDGWLKAEAAHGITKGNT